MDVSSENRPFREHRILIYMIVSDALKRNNNESFSIAFLELGNILEMYRDVHVQKTITISYVWYITQTVGKSGAPAYCLQVIYNVIVSQVLSAYSTVWPLLIPTGLYDLTCTSFFCTGNVILHHLKYFVNGELHCSSVRGPRLDLRHRY